MVESISLHSSLSWVNYIAAQYYFSTVWCVPLIFRDGSIISEPQVGIVSYRLPLVNYH